MGAIVLRQVEDLLQEIDHFLASNPECKNALLHDLLAYFAEKVTELNKQKQEGTNSFLNWLEITLNIQADKNGNAGLEVLTGKKSIKSYLGDYKKFEEPTSFEEIWRVLQNNTRHFLTPLSTATEQSIRQEYERSIALLLPLKKQLALTDRLIDQLVYRLYGLSEEEIALVAPKGDH